MPHAASYVIIISVAEKADLILYHMITPFDAFEISCIGKYYGKWSICSIGANAPFSIIFSKVFKTLRIFFLDFFQCCLKIENDVMI